MQTPLTRLPFHPPTDYYCEELTPVDGQICELLAKREELSGDNPGFPHLEQISAWSEQYGLNEDLLRRIFLFMYGKHSLLPPVEPSGFLKFVPILKSVEINRVVYAVTHMKQYSNASVVYIETEINTDDAFTRLGHTRFELYISQEYQCRQNGGYGQQKSMVHSFVVTPPLPDEVAGIEFNLTIKPFREIPEVQEMSLEEQTVIIK